MKEPASAFTFHIQVQILVVGAFNQDRVIFGNLRFKLSRRDTALLDSVTCSAGSSTAGALPGSVAVTRGVLVAGPVSATTTSLSLVPGVATLSSRVLLSLL